MENVIIEKPGEKVFMVKFVGANRGASEKELQAFIAGRKYRRYVDHFNPNIQIIELYDVQVVEATVSASENPS